MSVKSEIIAKLMVSQLNLKCSRFKSDLVDWYLEINIWCFQNDDLSLMQILAVFSP